MSTEAIVLSTAKSPNPSLDYTLLRAEGIKHIEKLSSRLWTDFNTHDPGITMLEMLCYAITDLAYRTGFDVKDILAMKNLPADIKQFYTIAEAATNKPLTINDYRRLLLDTGYVRNAWLDINNNFQHKYSDDLSIPVKGLYNVLIEFKEDPKFGDLNDNSISFCIFADNENLHVEYEFEFPVWDDVSVFQKEKILNETYSVSVDNITDIKDEPFFHTTNFNVNFSGPSSAINDFQISVKFRPVVKPAVLNYAQYKADIKQFLNNSSEKFAKQLLDKYLEKREHITSLLTDVKSILHAHRNLCEDFTAFSPSSVQEIVVDAEIQLVNGTNVEKTLAEIYFRIDRFLSPVINFYSIGQLLDKGKSIEEIFEGPHLKNGFIDEDELRVDSRKDIIYVSDIVQLLMDIPGVVAVKKLELTNYILGLITAKSVDNCFELTEPFRFLPRLNFRRSEIIFWEGNIKIPETLKDAQELQGKAIGLLNELKGLDDRKTGLINQDEIDLKVPTGEYSEIEDYYSVQEQFPSVYKLGSEGLSPNETPLRKAQTKQLKAYMLFFEQLLANYLTQLANVPQLFAVQGSVEDKTYFTNPLYSVPGVQDILKDFTDGTITDFSEYITQPGGTGYANSLYDITETENIKNDRKNRFLDHLLARFNEGFSEYAIYLYKKHGDSAILKLIADKKSFLVNYPKLSSDRAQAFNYKDTTPLSDNTMLSATISGLKRRVAGLTGIQIEEQQYKIAPYIFTEIYQSMTGIYKFRIKDSASVIRLVSAEVFYNEVDAGVQLQKTILLALNKDNYTIEGSTSIIQLNDEDGNLMAQSPSAPPNPENFITYIVDELMSSRMKDDFHIVENVLLRSKLAPFLKIYNIDNKSNTEINNVLKGVIENSCPPKFDIDQYSFRIDVILPAWTERFSDINFRRVFKNILRAETPAHIMLKFYWISEAEMKEFETCYQTWLQEINVQDIPLPETDYACMIGNLDTMQNLYDAYYVVQPKRFVTSYTVGETVAYVVDTDGSIIHAVIPTGYPNSPAGTYFNPVTGEITVSDRDILATTVHDKAPSGDGSVHFPLYIITTNSAGEITHHNIVLKFIDDTESILKLYTTVPTVEYQSNTIVSTANTYRFKHIAQITTGYKIAEFFDTDGPDGDGKNIVKTEVLSLKASFNKVAPKTLAELQTIKNSTSISYEIIPFDNTLTEIQPLGTTGFYIDLLSGEITTDEALLSSVIASAGKIIPIKVRTTDILGGTSEHDFDLFIKPDTEAAVIYTTEKNEDAYINNELIATISDNNDGGLDFTQLNLLNTDLSIVSSEIIYTDPDDPTNVYSTGLKVVLAQNTFGLDVAEIRVLSAPAFAHFMKSKNEGLVTGRYSYKLQFSTSDKEGGQTNPLDVIIKVIPDIEAVITYTSLQNEDVFLYEESNLLATITDANGGINHLVPITLSDASTVTLAEVGLMVSVVQVTGSSSYKAEIKVANAELFTSRLKNSLYYEIPGSLTPEQYKSKYVLELQTTDKEGGKSVIPVSIKVLVDHEAIFTPTTPKNQDAYVNGDLLATITDDTDGGLAQAIFYQTVTVDSVTTNSIVPNGFWKNIGLDLVLITTAPRRYEIRVFNRDTFRANLNSTNYIINNTDSTFDLMFRIHTEDIMVGQTTISNARIQIKKDFEGEFIINKNNQRIYFNGYQYQNGDTIVTFKEDNETIVSMSTLGTGTFTNADGTSTVPMASALPPGMEYFVDSATKQGYIRVSDNTLLYPGKYSFKTKVVDSQGGETTHQLELVSGNDYRLNLLKRKIDFSVNIVVREQIIIRGGGGGGIGDFGGTGGGRQILAEQPNTITRCELITVASAAGYSGLTIKSFSPSEFGTYTVSYSSNKANISTNTDGSQINFCFKSSFSNTAEIVYFKGEVTTNVYNGIKEPVEGMITFNPIVSIIRIESPIEQPINGGGPILDGGGGRPIRDTLTEATIGTIDKLRVATATDTQLATEYKTGGKDAQIAKEFNLLTETTSNLIVETNQKLQTSTGQEKVQAQQDLKLYAELYTAQVAALTDFVGTVREGDITPESELAGTFANINKQMKKL